MRLIDADNLKEATKQFEDCDGINPVWQIIDNAPTVDIQTAVMELYKRYQSRLATNVYEFGVELQELLHRYERRKHGLVVGTTSDPGKLI